MVAEREYLVVRESRRRLPGGKERLDASVANRDGMVVECYARWLDGDDPAGAKEAAFRYLGVPLTSTTTRRFASRHWISALRSFWSGQDFTGLVLPEPSVSIFPASKPLDTR